MECELRGGEGGKGCKIRLGGLLSTALCWYYSIFSKALRGGRVGMIGVSIYGDE